MERDNLEQDGVIELGVASETTLGVGALINQDEFLRQRVSGLTDE